MINSGTKRVITDRDEWTIRTADRKLSAHFEHTVAVTADGIRILTRRGSGVAAF
jgi:methionyl aminopeptidase